MIKLEELIKRYLGFKVRDRITGIKGIVTSFTFDLYGCVQVLVHPGLDEKGEARQLVWFDLNRVDILKDFPRVMDFPNFSQIYNHGPSEKPIYTKI